MADQSTILYGVDNTQNIVAVKAKESEVLIYTRDSEETVVNTETFRPWMLTDTVWDQNPQFHEDIETIGLDGDGFNRLLLFKSWNQFTGMKNLIKEAGINTFSFPGPEKQFLVSSGKTLFKGMSFEQIRRMQFDIETTIYSPESDRGRIVMLGLSDNSGYEEVLEGSEQEILSRFVEIVRERDPDVMEGHNIFGFDIPYIIKRAERFGIRLQLGRDASELHFGQRRNVAVGGYTKAFTPVHAAGRHFIDTLLAVQRYDVTKGRLERYGLKEVARVFGIAEDDRVLIPGNEIADLYDKNPDLVLIYNLQDVRETGKLSSIVCQSEFYTTSMVPDNYETVSVSGNGEKINSILIREYLRQGKAIPFQKDAKAIPGGYTDILATGLLRNVVKCDVESLYPSLMLNLKIKPATDTLDIFVPALTELTSRRLAAKRKAKNAVDPVEHEYWDGLQSSYKILINSFYGYLGGPFNFNDYDAAQQITTTGQELVKKIAETIEKRGGKTIEIDTDGVYFQAPTTVDSLESEEEFIEEIGSILPEGIRLAHDGRYAAMISLKIKNYVLIGYDGEKIFKGAALRSRSDEAFGKNFISGAVDLLLIEDMQGIANLYKKTAEEILEGKISIDDFSRRERVTAKTFTSVQKKRTAVAAEGLQTGEFINVYEKNDGTLGLVENYAHDENREKLLYKLYKFASRLEPVIGKSFPSLIEKPASMIRQYQHKTSGQQSLDLF